MNVVKESTMFFCLFCCMLEVFLDLVALGGVGDGDGFQFFVLHFYAVAYFLVHS